MARNTTPAPESREVPANEVVIAEEFNAANQLAAVVRHQQEMQATYSEDRDLANQMLGQIQMSRAISKFTDVVSLQKLKYIKENKSYRALSGQKGVDRHGIEITDVGTWVGFCAALGVSASKVDEDLTNLQIFGEDALAQLTQAGAGYRELRQYRKLPEDQKLALLEVAKTGDKGEFLDLAEEMIAKHAKEKEQLNQQLEESAKEHEATAKRLEVVTEQKEKAEAKAARIAVMKPDEALADLKTAATRIANDAVGAIKGGVRQALIQLREMPHGSSQTAFAAGLLGEMQAEINALREEFGLPDIASAAERELAADTHAWAGDYDDVDNFEKA